ncbi:MULTISPECIES: GDSL-type esterase/lipase family protein [unclassified Arcicella]|uniref:GDSL-type esterase/lipase family protein n=1 Tax=unclassified Arcicella TaxID=2644986 RepID=UPI00285CA336|nr:MULTISPECIES: GDSL-type esterase/lipase family protein [unclassified Arcicella]MDR6563054.1 lysophospholipase L1-like esterase [Arcicella sp. BE51]MDR6813138.1 lysophospholipase L1-like esterase [Arcicella sp. BE140]MDR6824452.1 lysophospholipase L1-like esterase [Arcicella sp. BE139]
MKKVLLIAAILVSQFCWAQNKFENEIKAFEKSDSISMPAPKQILLVGSSSLRLWTTYKEDLTGYAVINRGFGGSVMSDANEYFDRIVAKYQPKHILVYEGDNDLASGKSPETVFEDFKIFVEKAKKQLPKATIAYISIRPSIARVKIVDQQKKANQLIEDYCKTTKKLHFIDVQKHYYLPNGELMQDVFVADNLHLNAKGYQIWTAAIRKYLAKHVK